MNQGDWHALSRNLDEDTTGPGDPISDHCRGNSIPPLEVEEKPAVELLLSNHRLEPRQRIGRQHGACSEATINRLIGPARIASVIAATRAIKATYAKRLGKGS